MPLQTTGPISLKQIADEFEDAAPHSLSEFYGLTSTLPASGVIDFDDFYGQAGITAWLFEMQANNPTGVTSASYISRGTVIDMDGYIYTCLTQAVAGNGSSDRQHVVVKIHPETGAVVWQRTFYFTNSSGVAQVSLSNMQLGQNNYGIVMGGIFYGNNNSSSGISAMMMKIDTNGNSTYKWLNSYVGGNGAITTLNNGTVLKWGDFANTQQAGVWVANSNLIGLASTNGFYNRSARAVAQDTSNNIYFACSKTSSTNLATVLKTNSSLSPVWEKAFSYPGLSTTDFRIKLLRQIPGTNNFYVGFVNRTSDIGYFGIMNSSGTISNVKTISGIAEVGTQSGMYVTMDDSVDQLGNWYVPVAFTDTFHGVLKFNTSLALQWSRKFIGPWATWDPSGGINGVFAGPSRNNDWISISMAVERTANNKTRICVFKYPADGNLTGTISGTFGNYTITNVSLTANTGSAITSSTQTTTTLSNPYGNYDGLPGGVNTSSLTISTTKTDL